MDEESKPLMSFTIGPLGFYKCDQMPFGLTNVPVTFQHLMKTCLGDLNLNWCIIYLDDIVILSKDSTCHLKRLDIMFQKMEQAGFKLKPCKCELFGWQITYLGHIVSDQGRTTNENKIEAIKDWSTLTNVTEVQRFLEFKGYYSQFILKLV